MHSPTLRCAQRSQQRVLQLAQLDSELALQLVHIGSLLLNVWPLHLHTSTVSQSDNKGSSSIHEQREHPERPHKAGIDFSTIQIKYREKMIQMKKYRENEQSKQFTKVQSLTFITWLRHWLDKLECVTVKLTKLTRLQMSGEKQKVGSRVVM